MVIKGTTDQNRSRRWLVAGGVVVAALAGTWLALGNTGIFPTGPTHYVAIVNDTSSALAWSCSWSDLHLSPGESGQLEIKESSDEIFGCVYGGGVPQPVIKSNDLCPSVDVLLTVNQMTASDFVKKFHCR